MNQVWHVMDKIIMTANYCTLIVELQNVCDSSKNTHFVSTKSTQANPRLQEEDEVFLQINQHIHS
jgi:hypothetical protein